MIEDFVTIKDNIKYVYKFLYDKVKGNGYSSLSLNEDYIRILRVYGNSPEVIIPEKINNTNVGIIGAYCFSQSNRLKGAYKEEGRDILCSCGDYPLAELCGDYIEKVFLPDSVHVLESYAFYNCKNMNELYVDKDLREINNDAFMNCKNLTDIYMRAQIKDKTGLKFLLSQLNKGIATHFISDEKNDNFEEIGHFYYPEYTESYEEIGPAHIFAMNVEGEGYRARQCFNDGVVDVEKYDGIFVSAEALESVATLYRMAIGRLSVPVGLKEQSKIIYENFLKKNAPEVLKLICGNKDINSLDFLCNSHILDVEDFRVGIREAVNSGWTVGSAKMLSGRTNKPGSSRYEL
ncbi:MAG: leucine-rich repeat protein [Eubacteriales bacterium]|nr:leucine-rich repeat protein [Eubacteriales bacterium]